MPRQLILVYAIIKALSYATILATILTNLVKNVIIAFNAIRGKQPIQKED